MHRGVTRTASVVLAAVLLMGGACRQEREPLGPAATLPVGTTTTNPYAVPTVIDEAYVNSVLAGLDHAYGDVTRIVVSTRSLPPEVLARLKALYAGELLQLQIDLIAFDLAQGLPGYLQPPGDHHSVVTRIISIRPTCIFAEITRDASEVVRSPDQTYSTQWVALVPAGRSTDLEDFNPTGWAFQFEGYSTTFAEPEDPCADGS